jgi:DNA replication protein DnaC
VAWEAVRGWDRSKNLFIWGPRGVGKSSAAKYALGRAVLDGWEVAHMPCTKIEREMWQAARTDVLEKCNRADLLMIDDLTNAPWTPRGIGVLRDLLDVQHENGARVIVTSNHSPQDAQRMLCKAADAGYVESMLDRLHPVTVCEMRGNSYRKELSK